MDRQSERGSILVFILIGIAIFAALSYAVTSSMRLSSGDGMGPATEERMNIALTELRNVAIQSRNTIQMMVASGYAVDHIDVSASGPDGVYYSWTNILCSDDKCKLYSPSGGGLKFLVFSKIYPKFSGSPNSIVGAPQGLFWTWWAYKGTLQSDIIYRVEITKAFCNYINKKNGITADIDSFTASLFDTKKQLSGSVYALMSDHSTSFAGENEVPYLMGKSDGCYLESGSPNKYVYVAFVYGR